MRKIIYISVLLMTFFSAAQAQKKFVYEDTSLLQKEEPVTAPVEDSYIEDTVTTITTTTNTVPAKPYKEPEVMDTALYQNTLQFPFDSLKSWRNLKEYGYMKYLDSLLRNEKKNEPRKRRTTELPSGGGGFNSILGSLVLRVILWTLAIGFVLFIIYRLFLAEGVFQRRTKTAADDEAAVEEEVITKESDFDRLIRLAFQNGNYRQAIRYQYLRTLHLLADKNFVQLSPDKTNFQYVHEIANRSHQQDFEALTLNYEYVWYGEFNIEKDIYQKIETNFISLNQKL
ncbi:MAG: DUF4129 domain-containing protein [Ferruginibacter sp.]